MSAVCVLTPVVIGSWPVIQAAIVGALTSLGFTMKIKESEPNSTRRRCCVEEPIENSEVLEEQMSSGEQIKATNGDLEVIFGRNQRGRCTICLSGENYSENQLRQMAEQISTKVVQQYTYHKVISELKERNFSITNEQVTTDGTIKIHVCRTGS